MNNINQLIQGIACVFCLAFFDHLIKASVKKRHEFDWSKFPDWMKSAESLQQIFKRPYELLLLGGFSLLFIANWITYGCYEAIIFYCVLMVSGWECLAYWIWDWILPLDIAYWRQYVPTDQPKIKPFELPVELNWLNKPFLLPFYIRRLRNSINGYEKNSPIKVEDIDLLWSCLIGYIICTIIQ